MFYCWENIAHWHSEEKLLQRRLSQLTPVIPDLGEVLSICIVNSIRNIIHLNRKGTLVFYKLKNSILATLFLWEKQIYTLCSTIWLSLLFNQQINVVNATAWFWVLQMFCSSLSLIRLMCIFVYSQKSSWVYC